MFSDALMLLPKALGETVYMVAVSMIVASAIGIPLGVLLLATGKNQVLELGIANKTLSAIVNCVRSIPFIILMVAIIPFTRLIVGSSIGTTAAIVPLYYSFYTSYVAFGTLVGNLLTSLRCVC